MTKQQQLIEKRIETINREMENSSPARRVLLTSEKQNLQKMLSEIDG